MNYTPSWDWLQKQAVTYSGYIRCTPVGSHIDSRTTTSQAAVIRVVCSFLFGPKLFRHHHKVRFVRRALLKCCYSYINPSAWYDDFQSITAIDPLEAASKLRLSASRELNASSKMIKSDLVVVSATTLHFRGQRDKNWSTIKAQLLINRVLSFLNFLEPRNRRGRQHACMQAWTHVKKT